MKTSPWLLATYVVIIVAGLLTALPNVLAPSTLATMPSWLPHERVSLGLDLRGGSHLVLEVDADALVGQRLANPDAGRPADASRRGDRDDLDPPF